MPSALYRAAYGPPPMMIALIEDLIDAAADAARKAAEPKPRPDRGPPRLTLRPGRDTPLWNELVRQVNLHLRRRGSKAQLARLLLLPRQRLQDCLKARSASLDAERTLLLLGWLGFFQRGGKLVPTVRSAISMKKRKLPGPL